VENRRNFKQVPRGSAFFFTAWSGSDLSNASRYPNSDIINAPPGYRIAEASVILPKPLQDKALFAAISGPAGDPSLSPNRLWF
jgi:hypothetical protein